MRRDEIIDVVINDVFIIIFGNVWFMKSIDNKMKWKYFVSFYMRFVVRFLIFLRVKCNINVSMFDLIKFENFD